MFERSSCVQLSWSRGHNMQLLRAWIELGYYGYTKLSCPFPTFEHSTDCTCCGFGHLQFILRPFIYNVYSSNVGQHFLEFSIWLCCSSTTLGPWGPGGMVGGCVCREGGGVGGVCPCAWTFQGLLLWTPTIYNFFSDGKIRKCQKMIKGKRHEMW
jgi:hypothetical protein